MHVIAWVLGLAAGGFIGWKTTMRLQLEFNYERQVVRMPGSWSTLLLLLVICAAKVGAGYLGYLSVADVRGMLSGAWMAAMVFVVSGFCTGILLGRIGAYCRQYRDCAKVM